MWVDGNFNASSGSARSTTNRTSSRTDPRPGHRDPANPGDALWRRFRSRHGRRMSNSADNWEYKFDCSKEIPVIKFPSPLQLTSPESAVEARGRLEGRFISSHACASRRSQAARAGVRRIRGVLRPAAGAVLHAGSGERLRRWTGHARVAADSKAGITLRMSSASVRRVWSVCRSSRTSRCSTWWRSKSPLPRTPSRRRPAPVPRLGRDSRWTHSIAIQIEAGGASIAWVTRRPDRTGDVLDRCLPALGHRHQRHEHWEEQRQIA